MVIYYLNLNVNSVVTVIKLQKIHNLSKLQMQTTITAYKLIPGKYGIVENNLPLKVIRVIWTNANSSFKIAVSRKVTLNLIVRPTDSEILSWD